MSIRKGYSPAIVFAPSGRILAISTGSDAASEHECGMAKLMGSLTGMAQPTLAQVAAALRSKSSALQAIVGAGVDMPDLIERRRIKSDLAKLVFVKSEQNGVPVAALFFSERELLPFENSELDFPLHGNKDVAAAWDESSFAFKVRGQELVNELEIFAEAMRAGHAILAGTFLQPRDRVDYAGVTIAIESMLEDRDRVAMVKAQQEFESGVRLHMKSRLFELQNIERAHCKGGVGYIWPVWSGGKADSEVLYALNPGYLVDASYFGPYEFDQLKTWMEQGAKSPLRPFAFTEAEVA